MLSAILVPLDGSPMAEQALPIAEQLARVGSGRLTLVRAVRAFTFPGVDARNAQTTAVTEAQKYLDSLASRMTAAGLTIETAVPYGQAATEILDEISLRNADVLVMATHGRSDAGRWLYGSVADQVLRRATVPVVLVPPRAAHAAPTDREPVVLLALDGSALSEAALGPATDLTKRLGAELVVLQVVALPPYGIYTEADEFVPFDPGTDLVAAQQYLHGIAQRLRPEVPRIRFRTEVGFPAISISEIAVEEGAGFICMATHGRGGLARLVMGSVSTGVLQHATVPLLLVRPDGIVERTASTEAVAIQA
jgi:nucleotide-binding universal stress UspA family protein